MALDRRRHSPRREVQVRSGCQLCDACSPPQGHRESERPCSDIIASRLSIVFACATPLRRAAAPIARGCRTKSETPIVGRCEAPGTASG